jgi:hypothetical protein
MRRALVSASSSSWVCALIPRAPLGGRHVPSGMSSQASVSSASSRSNTSSSRFRNAWSDTGASTSTRRSRLRLPFGSSGIVVLLEERWIAEAEKAVEGGQRLEARGRQAERRAREDRGAEAGPDERRLVAQSLPPARVIAGPVAGRTRARYVNHGRTVGPASSTHRRMSLCRRPSHTKAPRTCGRGPRFRPEGSIKGSIPAPRSATCRSIRKKKPRERGFFRALFRTRTGDPLLTMEVLYQLS